MNLPDYNTCKPTDIIACSIAGHPSLYREALRNLAEQHRHFASQTVDAEASRIARRLAKECEEIANVVENTGLWRVDAESAAGAIAAKGLGYAIQAFNVAAKLMLVPHHLRTSIIERL